MATATRQRTSAKGKGRGKTPARATGSKATPSRKRPTKAGAARRGQRIDRVRQALARADVWGAALVVAGVLVALGTWAGLTGPLGDGVDGLLAGPLGATRMVVPLVLVWVGVLLVRGRPNGAPGRIVVGSMLVLVATNALLHLGRAGLGGGVGRLVAEPLTSVASMWGAA
ncbi:MAG TPA: hypothetical protein VK975_04640, partial [Acidimicrobiales bacterium]|nr:hypothetical protein [Acidimicrobiales bacterium]